MALFKNHTDTIILAIPGFVSVYLVWGIWGLALGWWQGIDGFSWTYWVGDHAILPLFNAIAFVLVCKGRRGISPRTTITSLIIIPIIVGTLMAHFEPDASYLREYGFLSFPDVSNLEWLHLVFIFGEACLVVFMTAVYPFLRRTWKPVLPITFLYAFIEGFLILLFVLDTPFVSFPLWIRALTMALVAGSCIAFVVQNLHNRLHKRGGLLLIRAVFNIRLVAEAQINVFEL